MGIYYLVGKEYEVSEGKGGEEVSFLWNTFGVSLWALVLNEFRDFPFFLLNMN